MTFGNLGPHLMATGLAIALGTPACRAQVSVEQQILEAFDAFVVAVNAGDPEAVADMYLTSSSTGSVGDGSIHRGWEAIAELLRQVYARNGTVQLGGEDVAVLALGEDAGVVYFSSEWALGQGPLTRYRGAMTLVFARTRYGWKVAHDHTSTLPGGTTTEVVRDLSRGEGGPARPIRETRPCTIVRVVDGDTVECDPMGRIRLIGMDTPESGQEPFGSMATEALAALLPVGGVVEVEADVENHDRYGRALRYLWSDGRMLNWAMVRGGYAVTLTYPPNVQYVEELLAAQEAARAEGIGLWAVDGFACPPQAYRRGVCR